MILAMIPRRRLYCNNSSTPLGFGFLRDHLPYLLKWIEEGGGRRDTCNENIEDRRSCCCESGKTKREREILDRYPQGTMKDQASLLDG